MENPVLLIPHILETFFIIYLGGMVFGFSSNSLKKFITIGIICGIIEYFIRSIFRLFYLPMGIHTLLLILIFGLIIKTYFKLNNKQAFSSIFIGFSVIMIGEILVTPIVIKMFDWNPIEVLKNIKQFLTLNLLNLIPILLIIIVLKGRKYENSH